jgi:hypothetical protein
LKELLPMQLLVCLLRSCHSLKKKIFLKNNINYIF